MIKLPHKRESTNYRADLRQWQRLDQKYQFQIRSYNLETHPIDTNIEGSWLVFGDWNLGAFLEVVSTKCNGRIEFETVSRFLHHLL